MIEPTSTGGALRWLGLFLDRKLSFMGHVNVKHIMARTSNGLRVFGDGYIKQPHPLVSSKWCAAMFSPGSLRQHPSDDQCHHRNDKLPPRPQS